MRQLELQFNDTVLDFKKQYESNLTEQQLLTLNYKKQLGILQQDSKVLLDNMQSMCTHEYYATTSDYTPGGYDYRSVSTTRYSCSVCNKLLKVTEHIGSFN